MLRVSAIIPGAGKGIRFASDLKSAQPPYLPKQFQIVAGRPLILWSLQPFLNSEIIDLVAIVVAGEYIDWMQRAIDGTKTAKEVSVVEGGAERQDSVRSGVRAVEDESDVVVVHDAVRPFVHEEWIEETVKLCSRYDGAIVAAKVKDTLKKVEGKLIMRTVDRKGIWHAQTPQTFNVSALTAAFANAHENNITATDEAQLVELNGGHVAIVHGSPENIKITSQEDWELAKLILEKRWMTAS